MNRKKGDLSLSVNAIVIFVLAFAMLGVGLFIAGVVKERAGSSIDTAFGSLGDLEQKPDAINPITLKSDISIKQGKMISLNVGFYNKNANTVKDAVVSIIQCIDEENNEIQEQNLPVVSSPSGDVEPGDSKNYKIIINLDGVGAFEPGLYTCTLAVCEKETDCIEDSRYEDKDFFLTVTG